MTRQNRVLPTGEIVALPFRGGLMGNRGILHDDEGRLGPARWRHKAWVCCVTAFKERRRWVMAPGRYTELFFTDEAVALAAGHRPCGECRRAALASFRSAWQAVHGTDALADIDRTLHGARVTSRTRAQVRYPAAADILPAGTFVLIDDIPHVFRNSDALPYAAGVYGAARPRPTGSVTVLTPAPTVATLAAGYRPVIGGDA
ncbi:hypothetical protein [uncultured Maritimibacter sp.]|jgi:hypothetical protein|uniref:hypothetical protein n=1 Tax=uncultured Maritimibacter sp. TaxID=991866 RepID=UPI000AD48311|nr:hypothetical protein [uncultured Maritimibacter sp.]